jgi:uncharacterized lipoprotein
MVYNLFNLGLGFTLLALLSACSTINHHYREFAPDRDTAYLDANTNNPLVLPAGVSMLENYHSPYIIPAGPLPGEDAEPIKLVPPGGRALWDKANAQVAQEEVEEEE